MFPRDRRAGLVLAAALGLGGPLGLGLGIHAAERLLVLPGNALWLPAMLGASALAWAALAVAAGALRDPGTLGWREGTLAYLVAGAVNLAAWTLPAVLRGTLHARELPLLVATAMLAWPFHVLAAFGCAAGLADAGLWTTCPQ